MTFKRAFGGDTCDQLRQAFERRVSTLRLHHETDRYAGVESRKERQQAELKLASASGVGVLETRQSTDKCIQRVSLLQVNCVALYRSNGVRVFLTLKLCSYCSCKRPGLNHCRFRIASTC